MATPTTNESAASLSLDEIEAAAARLNTAEREELLQRLLELEHPADPEIEDAWNTEIARRLEEARSGKVRCIPYEEVIAEMETRFCK